jgi:hypothetical protein
MPLRSVGSRTSLDHVEGFVIAQQHGQFVAEQADGCRRNPWERKTPYSRIGPRRTPAGSSAARNDRPGRIRGQAGEVLE